MEEMKSVPLFAVVAVFALAGYAGAVPIYSTLGPGDSYHSWQAYDIGWPGYEWDRGEQFMYSCPQQQSCTLDSIEIALQRGYISCIPVGVNKIDVWLMTDAGGTPGTIIESWSFVDQLSIDPQILVGTSILHPTLNPDTPYWLVASTPDSGSGAKWMKSSPAVLGSHVRRLGESGSWEVYNDITQGAFRINATCTPLPVPGPAAVVLGGLGISLVGYLRRRKAL